MIPRQVIAALTLATDLVEKLDHLADQLSDGASDEELGDLEARMARATSRFRERRARLRDRREQRARLRDQRE